MGSFIRRFLLTKPKPGTPRKTLDAFRNTYGTIDAVAGTSKAVYTVATVGPLAVAAAALENFKWESEIALLKDRVTNLEAALQETQQGYHHLQADHTELSKEHEEVMKKVKEMKELSQKINKHKP
ncbi:unnamed protein product [Prunus armeniaca]|uniref:Uncharacterized protein n=1 Tax=Prunus armeniaca TaxID=36596 RepID=A0A6J5U6E4_PRUAR|nr:unnamed protein product [Prunus armeniaca]